jgi:putative chromate ion transporter
MVQIADQKEELVTKGKWISEARFTRVFSLYQLLPGPEATELACYFGRLAGGPLGGLMGGLGFVTPGFLLMLLFAWFYQRYGLTNRVFNAVFLGLQPAMSALIFRACHKIGDFAFRDHSSKALNWGLVLVGGLAAFEAVLDVNYFITKVHLALVYYCWLKAAAAPPPGSAGGASSSSRLCWQAALAFTAVAPLLVFIGVIAAYGKMDTLVPMGVGVAKHLGNTQGAQFVVGLLAGLVTFGGAYTAIPFVQYETVRSGAWILNQVFLDSLAVCSILPTPLVMFITLVGYVSGTNMAGSQTDGLIAALLMTLGMFLPAFIMPIAFHEQLERLVSHKGMAAQLLDSVAATVVGQIAITGLVLLRSSVTKPLDAIIFFAALHTAFGVPHKYTPVLIVAAAAMAGAVLYF